MKFDIFIYRRFWYFGKFSEIIPEFFESKLVKLGQHLQKDLVSESFKLKLQKCENV